MAREIRISIDDDELFERMKRRKQALDLSWEEVLHRGLGQGADRGDRRRTVDGRSPRDEIEAAKAELRETIRSLRDELGSRSGGGVHDPEGRPFDPFDPNSVESFVADTVRESTRWLGDREWSDEFERVTEAEDAVLHFPFLGDSAASPANRVPLRVQLNVTGAGLDVDVVTVRSGKDVAEMNDFDHGVRRSLIEGLASGEPARLQLEAEVEEYVVIPELTWSRGEGGRPTVDDVTIEEVRFGDA
ncbi:MAG: hypothetical protein ACOC42_01125 [Halobacteriota archaeon]